MLDTNIASYVIKGHPPAVCERVATVPMGSVAISAITHAELLYGLARKGYPAALSKVIREFMLRVHALPWDERAVTAYADLRVSCVTAGITLGAHDMMIAAHAVSIRAILVTHDKIFAQIPGAHLAVEDWVLDGRLA